MSILSLSTNGNNAPRGIKAECSNCDATHMPLWQSGIEVSTTNSTATPVGFTASWYVLTLKCPLHTPLTPHLAYTTASKSIHGEGHSLAAPWQESLDIIGMLPSV